MSVDAFVLRVPPSRAAGILDDVTVARQLVEESATGSADRLELEEAWAPLHFALSGEPPVPRDKAEALGLGWDDESLENVLMGGDATPLIAGFGPARYLAPGIVASMADRLSGIPAEDVGSRVAPQELVQARVLPERWDVDAAPDLMRDCFTKLRDFYAAAAADGDGLLIAVG